MRLKMHKEITERQQVDAGHGNIMDVEKQFVGRQMSGLDPEINIGGVLFRYSKTNNIDFEGMISGSKKGYAIYMLHPNDKNVQKFKSMHTDTSDKHSMQNAMIFAWAKDKQSMAIMPAATRFVSQNRLMSTMNRGLLEGSEIGLSPEVVVIGVNSNQPIQAKTDTGADMCSMHVDSVSIDGEQVKFTISGSTYNTKLVNTMNVKQADSAGESRPVIKCNLSVDGATVRDVEVNLNNREGMVPLLLGKNFLQKGGFSIKTEDAEIDWDAVDALFEDVEYVEPQQAEPSITLNQIVEHLTDMITQEDEQPNV